MKVIPILHGRIYDMMPTEYLQVFIENSLGCKNGPRMVVIVDLGVVVLLLNLRGFDTENLITRQTSTSSSLRCGKIMQENDFYRWIRRPITALHCNHRVQTGSVRLGVRLNSVHGERSRFFHCQSQKSGMRMDIRRYRPATYNCVYVRRPLCRCVFPRGKWKKDRI